MALTGYQSKERGPTSHLAEQRDEDLQGGKDAKDIKKHSYLAEQHAEDLHKGKDPKDIKATAKEEYACGHTKDANMMLCVCKQLSFQHI